jgi:hypothetical protein
VVQVPDDVTALTIWFSYDDKGDPAWYYHLGRIEEGQRLVIDPALRVCGGRFGAAFVPSEVISETWGSATLEPGCSHGVASYLSLAGEGTQTLCRPTQAAGTRCSPR